MHLRELYTKHWGSFLAVPCSELPPNSCPGWQGSADPSPLTQTHCHAQSSLCPPS